MPRDFPRLHDGDALEPWHLNVVYDELRRLRKFQAAPPLALVNGGTDPPILYLGDDFRHLRLAVADGAISARSGGTLGSGYAYFTKPETFPTQETNRTPVKNLTDYQIDSGSYLLLGLVDGEWIVLLTGSCANLH